MSTKTFEGFSLSHAAILDPVTGLDETWGDIYGIRSGSIAVSSQSYDNTGDDFVLSSWFWFDYGEVTVQAGYVPFDLMSHLSGVTVSSSGAAPNDTYSMPLWTEDSVNQPTRPMRIRVPAKDSDGVIRVLDFILFKVQFNPFSFTGPQYKSGLLLDYSGRALISNKDETGALLPKRAIGRLVSSPA